MRVMSPSQRSASLGGRYVAVGLAFWFVAALLLSAAGLMRSARAPALPLIITALVTLSLFALWRVASLRDWSRAVDLRCLVLPHILRFIGIYFLLQASHGAMPRDWAVPAGAGDMIIASSAVLILATGCAKGAPLLLWNVLGLIDIMFVVVSAMRIGLRNWAAMGFLRELPLSLLPLFLVPLVITTHLLILTRLCRDRRRDG